MINFLELPTTEIFGGIRYEFKAKNGYGAYITESILSDKTYTLSIIDKYGNHVFNTIISDDDILINFTKSDVNIILERIAAL